jgi:prepilin-type processing-associated H-X9-DG protein
VEGNPADYARETKDFTSRTQAIPSRMALFIEMEDADDDKPDGREGQSADSLQHAKIIKGDCVWEWWEKIGLEKGRYNFKNKADGHFKGATKYSNVVFVDGHVAAIPEKVEDSSDKAEWNNHKDLDEVFTTLGKGSY